MSRLSKIAACRPSAIVLREKDLSSENYLRLAANVVQICAAHDVECILHNFYGAAIELGVRRIHLPLATLRTMTAADKKFFDVIGASCHSVDELREAENFGCTYATAGHVFATDCKKNLAPRGVKFLAEIVSAASIPIYAIGGISAENISQVKSAGAAGACVMSGFMTCADVAGFCKNLLPVTRARHCALRITHS